MGFMPYGYYVFVAPALLLALLATVLTKITFSRYSRVGSRSDMTGAEAAMALLRSRGVHDVSIEATRGFLSDHYDPRSKTLRLSPGVYDSPSLSAIGVACHEAGHALQHAAGYGPLALRSALVPAAQIGNHAAYLLLAVGMGMNALALVKLGAILFSAAVAFSVVTLPVEWNASSRAKRMMVSAGIVSPDEAAMAGRVLNAAFLTYVAGAVTALLQLLYFLSRAGLLGRRDD